MGKESLAVCLCFCSLYPIAIFGQDSLVGQMKKSRVEADYMQRTLADIVGEPGKSGGPKAFRSQAVFTGKTRVMPVEKKKDACRLGQRLCGKP